MTIELPANASADIASSTASFIAGMSDYVALIVGVVLAFWVIEGIIIVLRSSGNKNEK